MMRKAFPFLFLLLAFILTVPSVFAQSNVSSDNVWKEVDNSLLSARPVEHRPLPSNYRSFKMNQTTMDSILKSAPEEFSGTNAVPSRANEVVLTMPMPDGTFQRFRIEHSPIVEPGLSAKFPELDKTYRGQGLDDPTATARFDFLPTGFHSMILSSRGTVLIDPFAKGNTEDYISFYKRDGVKGGDFVCNFDQTKSIESMLSSNFDSNEFLPDNSENVISGTQLRTYRLAVAATVEYTAAVGGGTVAGALAAQVLIMNRVNGVYERDVAIRMVIIANNNLIVFAAEPDGYTNNDGGTMLSENQTILNTVIGTANYDIGHVFSTGGGGVAFLGVPCGANKAGGVTGLPNPVGDDFAIDYVAHEMGHQWGANHTFNGTVSNCGGGNRSATSAYEPGSGITIMAYAGICGNQNLAAHSIDTFHVKSLEVIVAYSQTGNGNTCAVTTATGNTPPTVTAPASFNIPKQTPFTLTASASDVNGDSITYDWQEYALGTSTTTVPNTDATAARPILRPYLPSTSPSRTFPSLQYILNNANVPPSTFSCTAGTCLTGELLPQNGGRTIPFQVIARDNRANGGGINTATTNVIVDSASGPFAITAPNTATTIAGGSATTVTWNVSNTTAAPVSAANVKISLSTDGGQTFPTVLSASTANDGTESVTLPNTASTTARIKVEAVGNIFFDINDANFTITSSAPTTKKPYDFDGDGKDDVSVYRGGSWFLLNSNTG
ncbi:MAG TPA: M12 family metallo-peptidase, partial [Pyrinomonadaceae bacterium]|nr:M12 family metallo-peptidase [Pyrinomonadaceae bacterium]